MTEAPGRLPRPLRRQVWAVRAESFPAEGHDLSDWQIDELQEMYGDDDDALAEAIGPEDGYMTVSFYGPYTKHQAKQVAGYLSDPEVGEREGIASATAMPIVRFVPRMAVADGTHEPTPPTRETP